MDSLKLLKKLIAFETVNPPGNEDECARFIGELLEELGFKISFHEFAEKRTTLIARPVKGFTKPPLCFTGHMDVVSLGDAPWSKKPFAGQVESNQIFGRGSSDMKSGIAAMICMAQELYQENPDFLDNIMFVFTAGEETCCEGAYHAAGIKGALEKVKALVVGEPTSNYPLVGHKGCVRFEITTSGKAAHASMPHLGDNAVYKAGRVIQKLEHFDFNTAVHPVLGEPTLCIGRIHGGTNINMVPDKTCIGIDIRSIPGQSHDTLKQSLESVLGPEADVTLLEQAQSIASSPENEWIKSVFSIMENMLKEKITVKAAPYFTDASALYNAIGEPPTIILGPGEAGMAHRTDEFCYIDKIEQAVQAYIEIVKKENR